MICPTCKIVKTPDEFPKKPFGPYTWMCRLCERNRASLRKHGITNDDKKLIAQHQCGCAICGHVIPGGHGWVVDHDHSCCPKEKSCPKCRRGILCMYCNKMLGNAFDRVEILKAAITYLSRPNGGCDWHRPIACAPRICGEKESA
jgi:hypothetical protein